MSRILSVLIVEDEPLIAMMLEDFLDTLGHRVVAAVDSVSAALERIPAGEFDLAILDIHLRDGEPSWAVADALVGAGTPFILSTGGHVDAPPERHSAAAVLAKPFTLDGVERALAELAGSDD